ncbi:MAG: hypothetical protein H0U69_04745, partial [Trueperaceae bacterium]|nr:hypothetical protein [Trueperaceae bacterium]
MSSIPPSLGGTDPRARSAFLRTRRRVGLALLAFAAALTLWTLSQGERTPLLDDAGPAACGERAPADATPVSLPRERNDAWNHLVGTVVCFTHELVVTELYDLGRHGALSLADRRLYGTGTGLEVEDDARHVVRLVAPGWRENAWPLPWGLDVGDVRVGDAVTDVAGRLGRGSDGGFDVVSVTTPSFEVRNPRPTAPPDVGGDLRIASFNVFNYFLTLGARGARDARELERQSAKLVAALALLDADVLALAEVENDDGEALEALALALNAALEAGGSDRRYA